MIPGNVFRLQLAAAMAGRRRMALRIGVTVLLALPFLLVDMPAHAQASGLAMVIVFTAFFGAAVGHARLRADQRLARLRLLPISPGVLTLDLVLASMAARLGPTAVVLAAFVAVNGRAGAVAAILSLAAALTVSLLLLTVLGMIIGRLARDNAEVHLFGALTAVVLAAMSGLTPLPERLSGLNVLTPVNPITWLHKTLVSLAAGGLTVSTGRLVAALVVLVCLAAIAIERWVSGGVGRGGRTKRGAKPAGSRFDSPGRTTDNLENGRCSEPPRE